MLRKPFITSKEFERIVGKADWAMSSKLALPSTARRYHGIMRRTVAEIVCRWHWLCNGYIGLPLTEFDEDLVSMARQAIRAADGMDIPVFPFSPRDYRQTYQNIFDMLPKFSQDQYRERGAFLPRDEPVTKSESADEMVEDAFAGASKVTHPGDAEWQKICIWGRGALGDVPDIYRGPEGVHFPGTFWDRASAAGGETSFDHYLGQEVPGLGFNAFEAWLLGQENRVYFGAKLQSFPSVWMGSDPLAERRIRAFFAGYCLHRSQGWTGWSSFNEITWEATMLPVPTLAWWLRYWLRAVDSGAEAKVYGKPENREKLIQSGLEAIAKNGGWPSYPDPMDSMRDWFITIEFEEKQIVAMMSTGTLMAPESMAETVGENKMGAFFETAAGEVNRFGFNVKPVSFGF